jgi:hypothetical protein
MLFERALTQLGYARWLLARGRLSETTTINTATLELTRKHAMRVLEADAWHLEAESARRQGNAARAEAPAGEEARLREEIGYRGGPRP